MLPLESHDTMKALDWLRLVGDERATKTATGQPMVARRNKHVLSQYQTTISPTGRDHRYLRVLRALASCVS